MLIVEKVDNLCIKITLLENPPYISFAFEGEKLTTVQTDLIYRGYIEYLLALSQMPIGYLEYHNSDIEKMIRLILSKEYNDLYQFAKNKFCLTIITYLLSNYLISESLTNDRIIPFTFFFPRRRYSKYYSYYLSFVDANVIEERDDIFSFQGFVEIIKYSDNFIDNHFDKFINYDYLDSYYISLQKPSFDVLIKHIEEFTLDDDFSSKYLGYLTPEQRNTLMLLNEISQ